ncbi:DEAD-box ATP-dependent RNA helicase 50-like [Pyrus communis]|uniref:DEAD-box ATP-dependent RNA helicase 50-like n=1 Tax=Pyrus communis TaxID=23211 RepID=UPI0035C165D1
MRLVTDGVGNAGGDDGSERSPKKAFSNKKSALLQLVEGSLVPKSIIFCNKIETCRKVENMLMRFDRSGTRVRVLPFHSALAQGSRLANMEEFTNSNSEGSLTVFEHRVELTFQCGSCYTLQLPSRYKYVRRVGRTARGAVGIGKAVIFVMGKQVSLAGKIMERNRKGHPVHDVPAAYELLY